MFFELYKEQPILPRHSGLQLICYSSHETAPQHYSRLPAPDHYLSVNYPLAVPLQKIHSILQLVCIEHKTVNRVGYRYRVQSCCNIHQLLPSGRLWRFKEIRGNDKSFSIRSGERTRRIHGMVGS